MRTFKVRITTREGQHLAWTAIAPSSIKLAFSIPKMLGFIPRSITLEAA